MCSPGFSVLLSEFYTCLNLASPGVTRMSSSQAAPLAGDLGEPASLGEAWAPDWAVLLHRLRKPRWRMGGKVLAQERQGQGRAEAHQQRQNYFT